MSNGAAIGIALVFSLSILTGCASTSPSYYTLDMTPRTLDTTGSKHLVAAHFMANESLTNRQILIKKSPVEVEYYAASEWAAGLDQIVAEKLQAEWGGDAGQEQSLDVSGVILAFEQIDTPGGADAHLKLAITIRKAGESRYAPALLEKTYQCRQAAAAPAPREVVLALNTCLETVAAEIAADAAQL